MRQTIIKAAKHVPSIKFVGGRHPIHPVNPAEVKPHFDSRGLIPGGENTILAGEFLAKHKPFVVVPYTKPAAAAPASSGAYVFHDRALKENEVSSIFELPTRFKFKPIEESEMDVINNGGAY